MSIKKKLSSIISGYRNLLITDEELEPLFSSRYDICQSCINNKVGICQLCGCVCKAKSHSLVEDCPANYWLPINKVDEEGIYILRSELPSNLHKYFDNEVITIEEWNSFKEEDKE